MIERSNGLIVGWAGFARSQDGLEQIIYGLSAAHWRGLGPEMLRALVDFADDRHIDTVFATVDPLNRASIHLLTTHGFGLTEQAYGSEADTDLYIHSRT